MAEPCPNCGDFGEKMWDASTGDCVCTECGIVLQSHMVDERPEWRNMQDDYEDHSRVGEPVDPLRAGRHDYLGTVIGPSRSTKRGSSAGASHHLRLSAPDPAAKRNRRASDSRSETETFAESLCIPEKAQLRASDLAECAQGKKSLTLSSFRNVLPAACVIVACEEEGLDHRYSLTDVAGRAGLVEGTNEYVILIRAIKTLKKHVTELPDDSPFRRSADAAPAASAARRRESTGQRLLRNKYGRKAGMSKESIEVAAQIMRNAEDRVHIRRSVGSVAGAVLFIATQLREPHLTLAEVAKAAGDMKEDTLRKTYIELHPYIRDIVTPSLASEADLDRLLRPSELLAESGASNSPSSPPHKRMRK